MNHPATEISYEPAQDILTRFEVLKHQKPHIRARDAANELHISEGELVAANVGNGTTLLIDDAPAILSDIVSLGHVMALTRNHACVHERKGVYLHPSFSKHGKMSMGLFANPDIDLRLFMNHWAFCFAVTDNDKKSIQFFDKAGIAIHKIYLTPQSNHQAYDQLVEKFKNTTQRNYIDITQDTKKPEILPDDQIDWAAFRSAWENLQDTHDFFPMLRKFKLDRQQAFHNIGHDFAYQVDNNACRNILQLAAKKDCEIMVFVGNHGCLQIHTGPVKTLKEFGVWYNVLDPEFNLHLNEKEIAHSWVTKKPTADGIVSALEIFDVQGEIIATLFGKRKPGIPELALWRDIINEIKPL